VLPYCLSNRRGPGILHICYDPYTSSVLPLKERHDDPVHLTGNQGDYRLSDTLKTMETREVEFRTLDDVLEAHPEVPAPDFLSLDTEGSELDIIDGAASAIADHVVAMLVEVSFVAMREGQALFGDICRRLDELGFDFFGLPQTNLCAPYRLPLGLRGPGFMSSGDALFFRRPDRLADGTPMRAKLALMGFLFEQPEMGFQVMRTGGEWQAGAEKTAYGKFLSDLAQSVDALPELMPKSFTDFFTFEASKARFASDAEELAKGQASFLENRQLILNEVMADRENLAPLVVEADTPVEAVLRRYGLEKLADQINGHRRVHALSYLETLGIHVTEKG